MHVSLVLRCSEQIRGRIYLSRGKISKVGHWLNNSVVSRIARGPGFESRSGHDFFLPCGTRITNNYTSHLKPPKNQNRRAAKNQIRSNSALIEDNMSMWRVLFAVESQISYRTSKCINSPHLTLLPGQHNPTTAAHVRGASFPADIWCENDVVLTSMRRDHVASTLIQRHFGTKCPLGSFHRFSSLYI